MRWKADFILLFVAAVWGSGFIAQRLAVSQLSTFYYNGGRFLVAAILLLAVIRLRPGSVQPVQRRQVPWMVLAGGLLFAAAGLQQAGLATTTIGNASFITGLYVVMVPLILFVALRQRIAWSSWLAVLIAALGTLLLSLQGEFRLAAGDVLVLVGAVIWAMHVILVGRLADQGVSILWFSVIQFSTCGLLNLALALSLDPARVSDLVISWPVILYSAVFPIGLGFSLQVAGQKHAPPVDAAILLSMEAVFGTLFGYLVFYETLAPRQLLGCALILGAMIVAQLKPGEGLKVEAVS